MDKEVLEKGSNEKIEEGLTDVERALSSLEYILKQIENGNVPEDEKPQIEKTLPSISQLIKETPLILAEITKDIRSKTDRLESLVL